MDNQINQFKSTENKLVFFSWNANDKRDVQHKQVGKNLMQNESSLKKVENYTHIDKHNKGKTKSKKFLLRVKIHITAKANMS